MNKIYNSFSCVFLLCFFMVSCNERGKIASDIPALTIGEKTNTSFYDIFSHLEIIELETKMESLIKQVSKLKYYEDQYYIFDKDQFAVLVFDNTGKYKYKIHRIGQGPGEYICVYDFMIDESRGAIELLNPFSEVLCYSGEKYIESITLPNPPISYYNFESLNDSTYVTFSLCFGRENSLYIVSKNGSDIDPIDYLPHDPIVRNFATHLFNYENKVFYSEGISDVVHELSGNQMIPAYEWHFGHRMNKFMKSIVSTDENKNVKVREYYTLFADDPKNFERRVDYQTAKYYYTLTDYANENTNFTADRYNVFYKKEDGKYHYFKKTSEGLAFILLHTNNDFAIGELDPICIEEFLNSDQFKNVKGIEKLHKYQSDDNPIILKMYYRD